MTMHKGFLNRTLTQVALAGCLVAIYAIVYFALWRGIHSSGKMVRFTAPAVFTAYTGYLNKHIEEDARHGR